MDNCLINNGNRQMDHIIYKFHCGGVNNTHYKNEDLINYTEVYCLVDVNTVHQ